MGLNFEEKIRFIIDNEGCEGANGFSGLQIFLKYCVGENERESLNKILEPIVDGWYESTKEYLEEVDLDNLRTFNELPKACVVCKYGKDYRLIKVNNLLFSFNGDKEEYTNEELFKIIL